MIVDELVPGFEGVADLLPINLLRGFLALEAAKGGFGFGSSAIVRWKEAAAKEKELGGAKGPI